MELLFYIFLLAFIIFLNIALYLPSLFNVDEDRIVYNIRLLKRQTWFQHILKNEDYQNLIIHNREVRRTIGTFNHKKMNSRCAQKRFKRKLKRTMNKAFELT